MTNSLRTKPGVSKENFDCIPFHVVEKIFIRIDAQTLFKCAFVCKSWNDLITSNHFISRSSERSFYSKKQILVIEECRCHDKGHSLGLRDYILPPNCCGLKYSLRWDNDQFDLIRIMDYPAINDLKDMCVIGVSNGLICLAEHKSFKLMLWNPTIRKYAWLPQPAVWKQIRCKVCLVFDRNNNDIKVVNLVYRQLPSKVRDHDEFESIWVFSYKNWSWKHLTSNILAPYLISSYRYVLFNGIIHWIAMYNGMKTLILTFDLTHEVLGQIQLPIDAEQRCMNSLVTTQDRLILIQERHVHSEEECEEFNFFSVWVMEQYGRYESWRNTFSTLTNMNPDYIGATKNGDLVLDMPDGHIRRYNPTTSADVLVKDLYNVAFLKYHTESLCLLEKVKEVTSY